MFETLLKPWRDYATFRLVKHALNPQKNTASKIRFWQRLGASRNPSEKILLRALAHRSKLNEIHNGLEQQLYEYDLDNHQNAPKRIAELQADIEAGNGEKITQELIDIYSEHLSKEPTQPKKLPAVPKEQQAMFVKGHGASLLSIAVAFGHPGTVLWLLQDSHYSAEFEAKHFNYPSDFSLKPLATFYSKPYDKEEYAAWSAVEAFLLKNVDVNGNIGRCSPLLKAIQSGYPKATIQRLYDAGVCVNNYNVPGKIYSSNAKFPQPTHPETEFTYGYTPLHAIVERWPLVQEKVPHAQYGARSTQFTGKPTAEQFALQQELEAMFDLLLQQPGIHLNSVGASVWTENAEQWSTSEDTGRFKYPLLSRCIFHGATALAKKLIERGVPIKNSQTVELRVSYPFMYNHNSSQAGALTIREPLLRSERSQQQPESTLPFPSLDRLRQFNALYEAIYFNAELPLIQYLLANGANPNELYYPWGKEREADGSGNGIPISMLHLAIENQRLDIVKALVEAGADFEVAARKDVYVYPSPKKDERDPFSLRRYVLDGKNEYSFRFCVPHARLVDLDDLEKYDPYDIDNVPHYYPSPLSTPWGYAANLALYHAEEWWALSEDDFFSEKISQKMMDKPWKERDIQCLKNFREIAFYLAEQGAKKILPQGDVHPKDYGDRTQEYKIHKALHTQYWETYKTRQSSPTDDETLSSQQLEAKKFIAEYQETPYKTLGIEFGESNAKAITHAYRQKALRAHPDRHSDIDPKQIRKINFARDLLNNPESKQWIDEKYRRCK